jgi:putative copper export protein
MEIGAAVATCAALVSLASLRWRALLPLAGVAAVVLLGLPTVTGHALQQGVAHGVSVPADLLHLAAAAFWIGGSFELALVAPLILRRDSLDGRRTALALVVRYSPLAVLAVALLGISGVARAFGELSSVEQVWTTGYGQALIVKSAVLGGLVVLGWLNRYRLTPLLVRSVGEGEASRAVAGRLRRSIGTELVLLAVALGAVAVLTNIRPGRDYVSPIAARARAAPQPVVLGEEAGDLAVGVGISARGDAGVALRATVLGPNGPASRLRLRFIVSGAGAAHFAAASPCGPGCYRATSPNAGRLGPILLRVERPGGGTPTTLTFRPPARLPAPGAAAIVRRAATKINHLRTLVIHSRLASDADHEVTTTYDEVAPNRLAYRNSDGSESIIIGDHRWDRLAPRMRWRESPQQAVREPIPFWPPHVTDAHVLRVVHVHGAPVWVVSFLDPVTPAWFTLWVDRRTYQTYRLQMIATAHFMHNTNGRFDAPIAVERPQTTAAVQIGDRGGTVSNPQSVLSRGLPRR